MSKQIGLAPERFEKIIQMLREKRIVRIDDICLGLGVSPATARRDVNELDRIGRIKKIHGGAVAIETKSFEPAFDDKAGTAEKQKMDIARKAAEYVSIKDHIYLDAGSTVYALTRHIEDMRQLTVITNSLRVASTLSMKGPSVIMAGGEFRRISQSFVGPLTASIVGNMYFDVAFMGTSGLTVEQGLTTTDPKEAFTKQLVLSHAKKKILMADASKIGNNSFAHFGKLSDIDILITDAGITDNAVQLLKEKGVKEIIIC